jgi:hypothetical protein
MKNQLREQNNMLTAQEYVETIAGDGLIRK